MTEQEFRLGRHRIWASMLRRTVPVFALVIIAGLLGMWGAYQEASYVAVATAASYATASFQAAKKEPASK